MKVQREVSLRKINIQELDLLHLGGKLGIACFVLNMHISQCEPLHLSYQLLHEYALMFFDVFL